MGAHTKRGRPRFSLRLGLAAATATVLVALTQLRARWAPQFAAAVHVQQATQSKQACGRSGVDCWPQGGPHAVPPALPGTASGAGASAATSAAAGAGSSRALGLPRPQQQQQHSEGSLLAEGALEVNVAMMTDHWYHPGTFGSNRTNPCVWEGRPLACRFHARDDAPPRLAAAADALWFDGPHIGWQAPGLAPRSFPSQAIVVYNWEPTARHPYLADPAFMRNVDITVGYHRNASLHVIFEPFDIRTSDEAALPPFERRAPAVAYIARNCQTASRRHRIAEALQALGVPLAALGACLHNAELPPGFARGNYTENHLVYQHYRVCFAMENSIEEDYVSEKLWLVLRSGCVPLFLGAPNAAADFLPAPDSAIFAVDFPTLRALAAEVNATLRDPARFERYTAWRRRPWAQLSPGYRELLGRGHLTFPGRVPTCALCQLLAARRAALMAAGTYAGPGSGGDDSSGGGADRPSNDEYVGEEREEDGDE